MVIEPNRPRRHSRLRGKMFLAFGAAILLLAAAVAVVIVLLRDDALTRSVRDILLILVALEFLVVGVALAVMLVQLSRLLLMLDLEIRPMLENANETLNTLRGTSLFLGENLVGPVIELSSSLAAIQRVLSALGIFRRSK
ncbi:MAG: hypothetical protein EHM12_12055 [Dehalococcoidia bacterium]|nr:MAG: hypothetical protein EHM12_12055 [Dehalococcoidia bacterium]